MNYQKMEQLVRIIEFCGIFSPILTAIIQKIKSTINVKSNTFRKISAILSILLGFFSAKLFSDFNTCYCIVAGVISFVGADVIYKALESKDILSSIKTQTSKKVVEIDVKNEIKG